MVAREKLRQPTTVSESLFATVVTSDSPPAEFQHQVRLFSAWGCLNVFSLCWGLLSSFCHASPRVFSASLLRFDLAFAGSIQQDSFLAEFTGLFPVERNRRGIWSGRLWAGAQLSRQSLFSVRTACWRITIVISGEALVDADDGRSATWPIEVERAQRVPNLFSTPGSNSSDFRYCRRLAPFAIESFRMLPLMVSARAADVIPSCSLQSGTVVDGGPVWSTSPHPALGATILAVCNSDTVRPARPIAKRTSLDSAAFPCNYRRDLQQFYQKRRV